MSASIWADEPLEVRAGDAGGDAGTGAELSDAERDRLRQAFGDGVGPFAERAQAGTNTGIDAAHLGVHGYRVGPRGAGVEQRAAGGQASGEGDGPGQGMPNQRHGDVVARALEQREDAGAACRSSRPRE